MHGFSLIEYVVRLRYSRRNDDVTGIVSSRQDIADKAKIISIVKKKQTSISVIVLDICYFMTTLSCRELTIPV